ncbi:MAG: ABC transporter ATP-binding protein [Candidatus Dojkabacteria bacterium]
MRKKDSSQKDTTKKQDSTFKNFLQTLKPYTLYLVIILALTAALNSYNLEIPKVISRAIDAYARGTYNQNTTLNEFIVIVAAVLILSILQVVIGSYTAERVAKDLRLKLSRKIAGGSFRFVQDQTSSKLLTNITSDVDGVKTFVSQAAPTLFSSIYLAIGAAWNMFQLNGSLALFTIAFIPVIIFAFTYIFGKIQKLFTKGQENIDALNKKISETIEGSALIRVLNSQKYETARFDVLNIVTRDIGKGILTGFATIFPLIGVLFNAMIIGIIWFGGNQVITGDLSIGNFGAFYSYVAILIMPIITLGFISTLISRSFSTFVRVSSVLSSKDEGPQGTIVKDIKGDIEFKKVHLKIGEKEILKDINLKIKAGTRNAIVGPTASGKTQLLYIIAGLVEPTDGEVLVDGENIEKIEPKSLYGQMGIVFQDSIIFNTTLEENIAFNSEVDKESTDKAINTAELDEFISKQPEGLKTQVSERGTSLSGGQKQRLTLARALTLNPKILLLDDFTARVDQRTEKSISDNLVKNYPDTTVISITQKVNSITDYDQIFLIMEGELLASGTHQELLKNSFEYKQIFESQKSTDR